MAITNKNVKKLYESDNPHLLLLEYLEKGDYKNTAQLSSKEKTEIVNKIIEKATHEEMIEIINKLAKLEFSVESDDPFRSGNRLAAQVIKGYVAHVESANITKHIVDNKKPLSEFNPDGKIIEMFSNIKVVADLSLDAASLPAFLEKKLPVFPAFYYQQALPELLLDEVMKGARPIELTTDNGKDGFNKKIFIPLSSEQQNKFEAQQNKFEAQQNEFEKKQQTQLDTLSQSIQSHRWTTTKMLIFRGGSVDAQDPGHAKYPQGVLAILNTIRQGQTNKCPPDVVFNKIKELAQNAQNKGAWGSFLRDPDTAAFYKNILESKALDDINYLQPENTSAGFKP